MPAAAATVVNTIPVHVHIATQISGQRNVVVKLLSQHLSMDLEQQQGTKVDLILPLTRRNLDHFNLSTLELALKNAQMKQPKWSQYQVK